MIRPIHLMSLVCIVASPLAYGAAAISSNRARAMTDAAVIAISRYPMPIPYVTPVALEAVGVRYDGRSFVTIINGVARIIKAENLDVSLRAMHPHEIMAFLQHGYVYLNRNSIGEYTLSAQGRLPGGKWLAGKICKYATMGVCWFGVAFVAKKTAEEVIPNVPATQLSNAKAAGVVMAGNGLQLVQKTYDKISMIGNVAEQVGNLFPWF